MDESSRQEKRKESDRFDSTYTDLVPSSTESWFAGSLVVSLIAIFSLVDVSGLNMMLNVFVKQLAAKECYSLNFMGETTV